MFQLDDKFLQDLGLAGLPPDQKQAFLEHIYQELELRVGTRLAEGLSDQQLSEFEGLIDRDDEKVRGWLQSNAPGYEQSPDLQNFAQSLKGAPTDVAVLSEYAATKWLELNRPDYRQVVAEVLEELKKEILSNKDQIIGGSSAGSDPGDHGQTAA